MQVLAPVSGTSLAVQDMPDPVFAEQMVGPGVAVEPAAGPTTVVSPIAGKVLKVMPHAFVVMGDGVGVLVHLGINTVRLEGEGFEVLAEQGSEVAAGDPVERLGGGDGHPSVVDLMDVWYDKEPDPILLERLLASPLAVRARANVETKLARVAS